MDRDHLHLLCTSCCCWSGLIPSMVPSSGRGGMTGAAGAAHPRLGHGQSAARDLLLNIPTLVVDPLEKQPGRRVVAPVRRRWICETFASAVLVVSLLHSKTIAEKVQKWRHLPVNANPQAARGCHEGTSLYSFSARVGGRICLCILKVLVNHYKLELNKTQRI